MVKLARAFGVAVFIGYSQDGNYQANLEQIRSAWACIDKPLVVLLITFECEGEWRLFDKLQTYSCTRDVLTMICEQPALRWSVGKLDVSAPLLLDSHVLESAIRAMAEPRQQSTVLEPDAFASTVKR